MEGDRTGPQDRIAQVAVAGRAPRKWNATTLMEAPS